MDKRKLSKKAEVSDYSGNSTAVTLEALHQLAASYFIDRESTLRKLHHIQIASTAIKVEREPRRCHHRGGRGLQGAVKHSWGGRC